MGPELLQLLADIFVDILEGVEVDRSNCGRSCATLDSIA